MEQELPNIEAKATTTNEEARAYFNANKEKFNTKETFSACHILIGNKTADQKDLTDAEIQAKIAKVQEELKQGKDFAEVAKNYSDDPGSKNTGGLYENIAFGKFVKEFEQAVRTQPIGQVGNPVKTQFGYHLIKVIKITPSISKTFEESKDVIIEQATAEKFRTLISNYINEIKKEVNYKRLDQSIVDQTNSQSSSKH
jgi:parvulin-like peptidyl-prolyl isomerase